MKSVSGLCKRIIPCLDVANGRTVKGIKFSNLRDMGDPVALATTYQKQGADELMFLDISASHEQRKTVFDLVARVAEVLSIPFTVGGGISELTDVKNLLSNGADKVSVNTSAVKRPELVSEIARACGSQCCVLAVDARRINGSSAKESEPKWEVLIQGGRVSTGMDAFEWARQAVENGAGEILLTSWDKDGTLDGFDIELVKTFAERLPVPVIASGGAHGPASFIDVFGRGSADAALAATIFHEGTWTVAGLKEEIVKAGIPIRTC
ncbi:MAG: imidazole glycerol phosphate synthase subunit HisF [Candidatus Melainabacteria bacterium]|nr:MAG: imidazole glycerol phosphate synthase subunit HisF [Candidatus Melainabacteria bacterium]